MAEKSLKTKHYSAIGVVKFSYKKAGYPDVEKIAKEWSKDPNFYQVIIRKVSKDDFGIQFIYYNAELSKDNDTDVVMKTYINPIKDLIYAYDIANSSGNTKAEVLEGILKDLPLE